MTGARDKAESIETIPAPPSGITSPTRPVALDVEALAAASSWEAQLGVTREPTPIDLCVPVRTRPSVSVDGAPLRAVFLLTHVDDRLSVAEIATSAQIPIADARASFALLADRGVVELRGSPESSPLRIPAGDPPVRTSSGLRPRTES